MALVINNDQDIKGITFNTDIPSTIKISQYADDTCLFLTDKNDIENSIKAVNNFSKVTGLKLNLTKTEGMCIGSLKGLTPDIKSIKWPKDPIRYLGIYIHNTITCNKNNWTNKLEMIQKLIDNWRIRNLTLYGKINVIKSLLIPKVVFQATILPIPMNFVKELEKIIYNFIWGKRDKIKRRVIINKYEDGGLQMIDLENQFLALKASWFNRIQNNSTKTWAKLSTFFITKIAPIPVITNMSFKDIKDMPCINKIPQFYQEVIHGKTKSNNTGQIETKTFLYEQLLWGNRNICYKNKCLYSKSFIDSKILYINDIIDNTGKVKGNIYNKLQNKTHYFKIIKLILEALKPYRALRLEDSNITFTLTAQEKYNFRSKHYYEKLVCHKIQKPKTTNKWEQMFDMTLSWRNIHIFKLKPITEIKIREFNYKILHNILATNYNLHRWKKVNSNKCTYCKNDVHSDIHLLYECKHIFFIWSIVCTILGLNESWKLIVIGEIGKPVENHVISIVSYLIYKKFLIDREKSADKFELFTMFIKRELSNRITIYKSTNNPAYEQAIVYMKEIIRNIE